MRKSIVRTGVGVGFVVVAAVLALAGFGLCLWSAYLWLAMSLHPATAAVLVGAGSLILAGGVLWLAMRLGR